MYSSSTMIGAGVELVFMRHRKGAPQTERAAGMVRQRDGSLSIWCISETGSDPQNVGSCRR